MKKFNIYNALFLALSIFIITSCNGDDDENSTKMGYFPKSITATTISDGSSETVTFNYNEKNQIIQLMGAESEATFGYNENGLISTVDVVNSLESYTIQYNGNIITSFTEVNTNDVFDVTYSSGTYNFDGGIRTFDTANRLTDSGSVFSITYNTNSGPFNEVDFQPVLFFLGGDAIIRGSYFFAVNEVTSFTIPLGGELTCQTTKDDNNNIIEVSAVSSDDVEIYSYTITYEERIINL